MTPLEALIRQIIDVEGPMRLDRYMSLVLGHSQHGYYMTRDPFGDRGDFLTAPEVSQVFGELIGVWCCAAWQAMGAPKSFHLIELGPGRGTLMSDLLRASRVMPGFREAAQVALVEISPVLKAKQRETLGSGITHCARLEEVPPGPSLIIANEFFDAIPIRQFERRSGRWFERVIGVGEGGLVMGHADAPELAGQEPRGEDGNVIEFAPARGDIAHAIGQRLKAHPGVALTIDYGHAESAAGDTLQAMRAHAYVPVTESPGECDLTSHVDFEALAKAVALGGAVVTPILTQRYFLQSMGLEARFAALAAKADEKTRALLDRIKTRLADEAQMGNLFKVLVAYSPGLATPYPFGAR